MNIDPANIKTAVPPIVSVHVTFPTPIVCDPGTNLRDIKGGFVHSVRVEFDHPEYIDPEEGPYWSATVRGQAMKTNGKPDGRTKSDSPISIDYDAQKDIVRAVMAHFGYDPKTWEV